MHIDSESLCVYLAAMWKRKTSHKVASMTLLHRSKVYKFKNDKWHRRRGRVNSPSLPLKRLQQLDRVADGKASARKWLIDGVDHEHTDAEAHIVRTEDRQCRRDNHMEGDIRIPVED